jgi:hypothetical protein
VILGEYSIDGLLRYGVPAEVSAKYAVRCSMARAALLAGTSVPPRNPATQLLPAGPRQPNEYEVPVSPVGNGLVLRGQAYRTSLGVIGSGLFWLVGALSDDRLDADRQLAPHAPPDAGAAGADGGDQLPPRDGELHAHRHAGARHARPHHLRERRLLPDDGLERAELVGRTRPSPTGPRKTASSSPRAWTTN